MDKENNKSLEARVEQLEAAVSGLKKALNSQGQKESKSAGSTTKDHQDMPQGVQPDLAKKSPKAIPSASRSFKLPENMRTSEYWLNKIGIGLVLFGVAFLFKYSIHQGWLTPAVRVGFGLMLGIGLVIAGLRISTGRSHFSQVLIGGGIATFYITGFAAFQLLTLISYPVAFIFMVSVTLLAFILSLKQNGVVLALIGTIGGLGTPFLLYTTTSSIPGLIGYTCLVLGGTSAIFFFRGWRWLLATSVYGGWMVFLFVLNNGLSNNPLEGNTDRWALQLGIIFAFLVFWVLPLIREFAWIKNPKVKLPHLHVLAASTPLIALFMSMPIWSLSDQTWGWITIGASAVYGFTSWWLSNRHAAVNLAFTHAITGVMLLTLSFWLLLSGNALLFTLATEALILHLIAGRLSDKKVTISAHLLSGIVAMWLVQRLFFLQAEGMVILNVQALTDLWIIGVTTLVSIRSISSDERKIYLFLLHVGFLGWLLRELSALSAGQGYVTIAWGVYAVVLLVMGLRLNYIQVRIVALGTLLIVVGKLFLVDLTQLETFWRILLFLGFGGLFLILSYYYRALWKSNYEVTD